MEAGGSGVKRGLRETGAVDRNALALHYRSYSKEIVATGLEPAEPPQTPSDLNGRHPAPLLARCWESLIIVQPPSRADCD